MRTVAGMWLATAKWVTWWTAQVPSLVLVLLLLLLVLRDHEGWSWMPTL
jgi:hypothetical protein